MEIRSFPRKRSQNPYSPFAQSNLTVVGFIAISYPEGFTFALNTPLIIQLDIFFFSLQGLEIF